MLLRYHFMKSVFASHEQRMKHFRTSPGSNCYAILLTLANLTSRFSFRFQHQTTLKWLCRLVRFGEAYCSFFYMLRDFLRNSPVLFQAQSNEEVANVTLTQGQALDIPLQIFSRCQLMRM